MKKKILIVLSYASFVLLFYFIFFHGSYFLYHKNYNSPNTISSTISLYKKIKSPQGNYTNIYMLLDSSINETTTNIWLTIDNIQEKIKSLNDKNIDSLIILKQKNMSIHDINNRYVTFKISINGQEVNTQLLINDPTIKKVFY